MRRSFLRKWSRWARRCWLKDKEAQRLKEKDEQMLATDPSSRRRTKRRTRSWRGRRLRRLRACQGCKDGKD